MKKSSLLIFLMAFGFLSCSVAKKGSFHPAKKYSSEALKDDFSVLTKVLASNHPSLYWYSSKDSVDGYFAATAASLTDSLTEQQFRNRIAWALNKIHCGHTTVRASKPYAAYYSRRRLPQFPLQLKIWKDSAVVVANMLHNDSVFRRGTIVTSINGFSTRQIIDSLCQFIGTDGYSNNFKYQAISFNFPAYYKNVFGLDSVYHIGYTDSIGNEKRTTIKNYIPSADSLAQNEEAPGEPITKKQLRQLRLLRSRSFSIDTATSTAYISVNTFSQGKLVRFFRKTFRDVRKEGLKNVVIDLRLNTGGNVITSTRLLQYLSKDRFTVADTIAAFTRRFPYKKHIKPWFIYWLSMQISGRRYADNRIHFRYFEKHNFRLKKKNHFDGNIYIITGGYTFSAATLVAGKLKGQDNVTLVGEETGGGAYGNSAMHLTTIVLPNTGIRVTLPLFRMVLNAKLPINGRGIFPDVEVEPTSFAIKAGVNAKLDKVKELIETRSTRK